MNVLFPVTPRSGAARWESCCPLFSLSWHGICGPSELLTVRCNDRSFLLEVVGNSKNKGKNKEGHTKFSRILSFVSWVGLFSVLLHTKSL